MKKFKLIAANCILDNMHMSIETAIFLVELLKRIKDKTHYTGWIRERGMSLEHRLVLTEQKLSRRLVVYVYKQCEKWF